MSNLDHYFLVDDADISLRERRKLFWNKGVDRFQILVIGGGIQGAFIYHLLSKAGYSVLLVDKGDFGGGTSQASALSVWGGLLYLRYGWLRDVIQLSSARDWLVANFPHDVKPHLFRYVYSDAASKARSFVKEGLWLYWLLGRCKRSIPRCEPFFQDSAFFQPSKRSITYEEGQLTSSDCRFVFDLIAQGTAPHSLCLNYTACRDGAYESSRRRWAVSLEDKIQKQTTTVHVDWIINAGGVWTDEINTFLGISSPYRHAFSKGVSITIPRPQDHRETLVFDTTITDEEGMSLVPWGPVSLWGSTEEMVDKIEGSFNVSDSDVCYLLTALNRNIKTNISSENIIARRVGLRPLPILKGEKVSDNSLLFSRKHLIFNDYSSHAIVVYGGKITSGPLVAQKIKNMLSKQILPLTPARAITKARSETHQKFSDILCPSISSSIEHELVYRLEDYTRRRTNISQWIPNGGMGKTKEHADLLFNYCKEIHGGDEQKTAEDWKSFVSALGNNQ